jgi:hypothetical protein
MLVVLFFSLGAAFVGFVQLDLCCKFRRLIRQSELHAWGQHGLLAVVCVFLTFMYLPYVLRLFYKWPEHEVSTLVLYGMLSPVSLWGLASVSTFLIVVVKDSGTAVFWLWKRLQASATLSEIDPQEPSPAHLITAFVEGFYRHGHAQL